MIFLVYTKYNSDTIQESIGESEYSYYFVLKKFLPVLEKIGEVRRVENPFLEVDPIYEQALQEEQTCFFLSFTAPHNTIVDLKCPTIPVFAWEYDTIPNESWDDLETNNWVYVLKKLGAAITHSQHSVQVVKRELGENFPIISCPAPLETKLSFAPEQIKDKHPIQQYTVNLSKEVIDSQGLLVGQLSSQKSMADRMEITHVLLQSWSHKVLEDIIPHGLYRFIRKTYLFTGALIARTLRFISAMINKLRPRKKKKETIPPKLEQKASASTTISGIIYTSILNIFDNRKNYADMLTAFCFAMKDKPDATLILKTPIMGSLYFYREKVTNFLRKLPAFSCRVVVIGHYLDSESYLKLLQATSFYVNTSYGEGQCLPLMEYMAAGVPAIAPKATALVDYVDDSNAFTLKTCAVPTAWQHDERRAIRTVQHRPDWYALVQAYQASYEMAKHKPADYHKMSSSAHATLRGHISAEKAEESLRLFFKELLVV
mgnify:CR=1 FL=1